MNRRRFLTTSALAAAGLTLSGWPETAIAQVQSLLALPWRDLETAVKGRLLYPTMPEYAERRLGYQARYNVSPQAILQPTTPADIVRALEWCSKNQVRVHTKGGGHSYEGLSLGPGLLIDLKSLNSKSLNSGQIQTDSAARRAWIPAGATLGEVALELDSRGYMIPTGSCPTVGVSGLTLGGGYGLTSRHLGLTCDNVVEFETVTAQGKILSVRADTYPDLDWALRGAGNGQFGIVTRFKFRLTPSPKVTVFDWRWGADKWKRVLEVWQSKKLHKDSRMTALFSLSAVQGDVYQGRMYGLFWGAASQAEQILKEMDVVGSIISRSVYEAPYYQAFKALGVQNPPRRAYFKSKSDYVYKPWDAYALKQLEHSIATAALPGLVVILDPYGGAIAKYRRTDTAFVHRDALFQVQYFTQWSGPQQTAAHLARMRLLYSGMRPCVSGEAYASYADIDLQDPLKAYYAENHARLKTLKSKWDPTNVFRHAQSL